jgi:hypothetical protein
MKPLLFVILFSGVCRSADTVPLVPLNELGSSEYMGFKGGLYADGKNEPSGAHADALKARCAQIQPLDAEGKPSPRGSIVVAGIGASVCRQIFQQLEQTGAQTGGISPVVKFVNCAVGGADVNKIAEDRYWAKAQQALEAQGITAAQVQVVWYQSDDLRDTRADFPGRPQRLQAAFAEQMKLIGRHFPNARICYHSARHTTAFMPEEEGKAKHAEPRPYYVGWAVKWLVESADNGKDSTPLVTWAGYFWTAGAKPRADGYHWTGDMNVADGVHLTDAARERVAKELCEFWRHDAFAKTWFTGRQAAPVAEKPVAPAEAPMKPQVAAAQALKPGEAALLINGKSKFAKLERLLATNEPVRLVVYDVKDDKELLAVDDVFHQRIDLNEKVGSGEFRIHFLGKDGKRLPMTMDVPDVVKIK